MGDIIRMDEKKKETPFYYTNVFELTIGPYDFTFVFGYKTPEQAKKQTEEFNPIATISMSPTQAKTAVVVLQEMVAKYEKGFGEIPMENRFKERYKKIFEK